MSPRIVRAAPPPPASAALVGATTALLTIALIWAGREGCDAARGTTACGGWGLIMLLAILGAALLLARVLLVALGVPDPSLVAFIGVALPLVGVLALLTDSLYSSWVWVVLPLATAGCFALATWLVQVLEGSRETSYVDEHATRSTSESREIDG